MSVPGTVCSATDMTVAKASKAPAAPIMWPVIDFVPEIASERRSRGGPVAEHRPDRLGLAGVADRRRGAVGVDEVDLVGRHAAALERHLHRPRRAGAALDRLDHVPAVGRRAVARRPRRRSARRAPSPARGPRGTASPRPRRGRSRCASRRTGARPSGAARRGGASPGPACSSKPAWATSSSGASVEPLMTAMQSPRRIASAPSATLWVPVEQAETIAMLWPIAPVSIAIIPEVEVDQGVGDERRRDPVRAPSLERRRSCRSSAAGRRRRSRTRRRPRSGSRR